jgi:hypothetical protein
VIDPPPPLLLVVNLVPIENAGPLI